MSDLDPATIPTEADVIPLERDALLSCRRGEIQGLEKLYAIYAERVFRTCLRVLGDREAAEDQTHEVFLRVFAQIGRFDGRSRFSTWLYRLTMNHTLNRLRKRKRRWSRLQEAVEPVESPECERPDRRVRRREARDQVQALLASLSPDHRAIVVLREIEGLDYAEIAAVLGIARGTVMSRLHRARRVLRQEWMSGMGRNELASSGVQSKGHRS